MRPVAPCLMSALALTLTAAEGRGASAEGGDLDVELGGEVNESVGVASPGSVPGEAPRDERPVN